MKCVSLLFLAFQLFFLNSAVAQNCKPKNSENLLRKICDHIRKSDKRQLQKMAMTKIRDFVYDDCGLSSVVIYDIKAPYVLLAYPLRAFLENKLAFADVPFAGIESPMVLLANKVGSSDFVTLEKHKTPIGLSTYLRNYQALRCNTKDQATVVVATAQSIAAAGQFVGSNISAIEYSILDSFEIKQLAGSALQPELQRKYFLQLSKKVMEASVTKIAAALNVPETLIENILLSRANEDDHYFRFESTIADRANLNKYTIVGFLQSDIEHALALSTELREVEKLRRPSSSKESWLAESGDGILAAIIALLLGVTGVMVFKRANFK